MRHEEQLFDNGKVRVSIIGDNVMFTEPCGMQPDISFGGHIPIDVMGEIVDWVTPFLPPSDYRPPAKIHEFMVRVVGVDYILKPFGDRNDLIAEKAKRLGWQFDRIPTVGYQLSRETTRDGKPHIILNQFETIGGLVMFLAENPEVVTP